MTYLYTALRTEGLKIRKSKVIWMTAAAFTIAPLMAGFFMFVLKDPALAKRSGLLGAKAQIAGEASWPSYLHLHAQMMAVGGMLVFGFVTSWIFGREYADRTAKDLLALPSSRTVVVAAKFIAAFLTNLMLAAYVVSLGFFIGWMIGLPQWSLAMGLHGLFSLGAVTVLTIALCTPAAFFACYGRGYLAPLGFVILTLVLSQIVTVAGYGDYFPWAIPAIISGIADGNQALHWGHVLIISATSLSGIFGTLYWWLFADQH